MIGFSEGCETVPVSSLIFEDITIGSETYTSKTIWIEKCDDIVFRNVKMYNDEEPTYNNRVSSSTNIWVPSDTDTTLQVNAGGKIISGATDTTAMTVENGATVGELRKAIRNTGNKTYAFYNGKADSTALDDTVTFDTNGTKYLKVTAPDNSTEKWYSITVRDPIITATLDATKNGVSGNTGSSDGKYFNVSSISESDTVTLTDKITISDGRCFRAAYTARTASTCGIFELYLVSDKGAEVKVGSADMQTGKFTQDAEYAKSGIGVPAGTYTVKFVCTTAGTFSLGTLKLVGDDNYEGGFLVNLSPLSDLTFVKDDPAQTVEVKASASNATVSYEAQSSNTNVATVSMNGTALTVTPGSEVGETTITVTAKATGYDDATRTFKVTVTANAGPIEIDVVKLVCDKAYSDISNSETIALKDSGTVTLTGIKDTISSFNVTCNKAGNVTASYFQVSGKNASEVPVDSVVQLENPITLTREGSYTATLYTKTGNNRGTFKVQLVPVNNNGSTNEDSIIDLGSANLNESTSAFKEVAVTTESSSVTVPAGQYKLRFVCTTAGFLIVRNITLTPVEGAAS